MSINNTEHLTVPDKFDFPFVPYTIQHDFMSSLYKVIENKQLGIFESPTGTGKSLSIICGSLCWLRDHYQYERDKLVNEIELLENQHKVLQGSTTDWFTSQSADISVKHKSLSLKAVLERINKYESKIKEMQEASTLMLKRNKYLSKNTNKNSTKITSSDDEETTEEVNENDLLLNDFEDEQEDESADDTTEEVYEPIKIYICSRTHSQLSQFVSEIKRTVYKDDTRVITLASRQNYCINDSVRKLKTMNLMNQRCLDLQKQQISITSTDEDDRPKKKQKGKECRCPFYKKTLIEDMSNFAITKIQDIEDLVKSGKSMKACPYYASRKAAEDAQIVLVPYNTILHESTRKANGIKIKNNIIIIDEAHNLLDAVVQMHNAELTYNQLYHALEQLKSYKAKFSTRFSYQNLLSLNQLITICSRLFDYLDTQEITQDNHVTSKSVICFVLSVDISSFNLFNIRKFAEDSRLTQKLHSYSIKYPVGQQQEKVPKKGVKQFLTSIENKGAELPLVEDKKEDPIKVPLNPLQAVLSFLEKMTFYNDDGMVFIHLVEEKKERKFQYLLLNPSSQFEELIKEARSVIVAGGTMKPMEEFRKRLFQNAGASCERIVEFSCGHVVQSENILPLIITHNVKKEQILFNFENRYMMGDTLIDLLTKVCGTVCGGIVVFFPSYNYENWFWQKVKNVKFDRKVYREPQNTSNVDDILDSYAKSIKSNPKSGALMFSVVGGKLSEGLNFSDDLGRCVIVVGLPYANITSKELKERMRYLEENEVTGAGQQFYENLCIKAINQCIGRAIRHRNDYATIILLDQRYNRLSVKNSLPDWIQQSLQTSPYDEAFDKIQKFFQQMKK